MERIHNNRVVRSWMMSGHSMGRGPNKSCPSQLLAMSPGQIRQEKQT